MTILQVVLVAAAFIMPAVQAEAQPAAPAAGQVYELEFFDRFAPRTARDVLDRVPGFTVRQGESERGLGQGGTNVLINGERVTAKGTGPLDVLAQTPASSVVRVEVRDAAALGVTGLSGQVANVVLDRSGVSGNYEWRPQFREGLPARLTAGTVSVSGEQGRLAYSLGIENDSFRAGSRGPELVFGADGALIEERYEDGQFFGERPSVTTTLAYDFESGAKASFTGSAESFAFDGRELSVRPVGLRRTFNSEDEWNAEGSGELSWPAGPGTARLIAYQRFEHSPFVNVLEEPVRGRDPVVSTFAQTADEGESILRGEYAWSRSEGRSWEVALEGAFNLLDTESRFESGGEETVFAPVRVEELRVQSSVTRGTTLGGKLAVQASLGAEWSEITRASEGNEESRSFFRPRGFLTLAYPFGERTDLRLRAERSVGQLNFFDFVSSVDLVNEREVAGNAALRPQQAWEFEAEAERRFGPEEKVVFRVQTALIEDLVDRVLVAGQDAVGNIDSASSIELALEGTLLTDRFGLTGGRFDLESGAAYTSFDDPLTGREREFGGNTDRWFASLEFRHDVPRTDYAWGFEANRFDETPTIRVNETSQFGLSVPSVSVFAEHKDLFGATLRVSVFNVLDQDEEFRRIVYDGLRTEAPVLFVEDRTRSYGPILSLTISGAF